MPIWHRVAPLGVTSARQTEEWRVLWNGNDRTFPVDVHYGKRANLDRYKSTDVDELRRYSNETRDRVERLYPDVRANRDSRQNRDCPCCDAGAINDVAFEAFGVEYVRCGSCSHVYVGRVPDGRLLDVEFEQSADISSTYTDPGVTQARIDEIAMPKAAWVVDRFQTQFGRIPRTCVDVGAGGGHFVQAVTSFGLDSVGYEVSEPARSFARAQFGLDLVGNDFRNSSRIDPLPGAEIVTMWGLLEYIESPREFISAARKRLEPSQAGILVVEVPRYEALSTDVQRVHPQLIARHMDPSSHINCFTESSLLTALLHEGFVPVAAWFFGMDAYELSIQAAARALGSSQIVADALREFLFPLQQRLDVGLQSDDLVVAAVLDR